MTSLEIQVLLVLDILDCFRLHRWNVKWSWCWPGLEQPHIIAKMVGCNLYDILKRLIHNYHWYIHIRQISLRPWQNLNGRRGYSSRLPKVLRHRHHKGPGMYCTNWMGLFANKSWTISVVWKKIIAYVTILLVVNGWDDDTVENVYDDGARYCNGIMIPMV